MTTTPEDPARQAFSRRAFLKGASVAAVTGSVAGTLPAAAPRTAQVYGPGFHQIQLKVNGQVRDVSVEFGPKGRGVRVVNGVKTPASNPMARSASTLGSAHP